MIDAPADGSPSGHLPTPTPRRTEEYYLLGVPFDPGASDFFAAMLELGSRQRHIYNQRPRPDAWVDLDLRHRRHSRASESQTIVHNFLIFIVSRQIPRQLLVTAFVGFHMAVALCGPCLHDLPGMGHEAAKATTHPDLPDSSHHPDDSCSVCHFVAQGQLPIETIYAVEKSSAWAWLKLSTSPIKAVRVELRSRQRAPPDKPL